MFEYNDLTQLHIELSSMCNAACPGCPRNVYGGYTVPSFNEKQMSLELFKPILYARLNKMGLASTITQEKKNCFRQRYAR